MLRCFLYKDNKLKSFNVTEFSSVRDLKKQKAKLWVLIKNPDQKDLDLLKKKLKLHPTTIEDILTPDSRIKYEELDDNTLIVVKGVRKIKGIKVTFYSLFIIDGDGYVITAYNDSNETIDRLAENPRKIIDLMKNGEDFLVHYIIDKEVDRYVDLKNDVSDSLKELEEGFMVRPTKDALKELFLQEKLLLEIKQRVDVMTDVCQRLMKPTDNFIQNDLIPYFRDVYDHISRVSDSFKTYLERINGIRNSYLSLTSYRMNESMHLLTIVMTIMMPLSVITGFYGMNIRLPFQDHPVAAGFVVAAMVLMAAIMLLIFRKMGLLGGNGHA
jgi:magnesium transporter